MSNETESAAAALIKASRKNLIIRFFEHNGVHFYKGNNLSTNVSGKFAIKVDRIAEVLYPKIRLDQGSGITPGEFLFNRCWNIQRAAGNIQRLNFCAGESTLSDIRSRCISDSDS